MMWRCNLEELLTSFRAKVLEPIVWKYTRFPTYEKAASRIYREADTGSRIVCRFFIGYRIAHDSKGRIDRIYAVANAIVEGFISRRTELLK